MTGSNLWAGRKAPTLDDFEILARQALESLPQPFLGLVEGVPFTVAKFAEDDVLEELEIESPFDLMGLFQGVGLPEIGDTPPTGMLPNRIFLYRRAILDFWAEEDETLGDVITHVLIHEIGHHFGYSDEDMEAIEAEAEREGS